MKHYVAPHISVTSVALADIVTVSVGSGNSITLDFGSDFFAGIDIGNEGKSNSVSWNTDFR